MTINTYFKLLNGYLTRSGYDAATYVTAQHYYFKGLCVTDAADKIIKARAA